MGALGAVVRENTIMANLDAGRRRGMASALVAVAVLLAAAVASGEAAAQGAVRSVHGD